jgi:Mg2+/Co2+ transporter CorC
VLREDGSWVVSGSMPVDEMAERLGIPIPQERGYHTAAGFVLDWLGQLPAVGERFNALGWQFEIVDLDGRRVDKILARRVLMAAAGRLDGTNLEPRDLSSSIRSCASGTSLVGTADRRLLKRRRMA